MRECKRILSGTKRRHTTSSMIRHESVKCKRILSGVAARLFLHIRLSCSLWQCRLHGLCPFTRAQWLSLDVSSTSDISLSTISILPVRCNRNLQTGTQMYACSRYSEEVSNAARVFASFFTRCYCLYRVRTVITKLNSRMDRTKFPGLF